MKNHCHQQQNFGNFFLEILISLFGCELFSKPFCLYCRKTSDMTIFSNLSFACISYSKNSRLVSLKKCLIKVFCKITKSNDFLWEKIIVVIKQQQNKMKYGERKSSIVICSIIWSYYCS